MKIVLLLTLTFSNLVLVAHARTWTSADGSQTFDGEYVSSTETTVTVIIKGHQRTFKMELLSASDKKWVAAENARREKEAPEKAAQANPEGAKIAKQLKGRTTRLIDGKFVKQDTQKAPAYYLLYFTASW